MPYPVEITVLSVTERKEAGGPRVRALLNWASLEHCSFYIL